MTMLLALVMGDNCLFAVCGLCGVVLFLRLLVGVASSRYSLVQGGALCIT